ncbi:MAG: hypothetical protein SGI89_14440 [bacterium]|nr:hypothetical protein [bacterium]
MNRTLNTRTDLESLKSQYTKSLKDIDMEIRSSGKFMQWRYELADLSGQLEYEKDEIMSAASESTVISDESTVVPIDDEKLKKDLFDVKDIPEKKEIKDSKLNPNSETEFKEPDPDERIHIAESESGNKDHPL